MKDILRRYFVANRASVISIRRLRLQPGPFIRCRCGNADGFFWGRWHVMWRVPYSKVWAYDGHRWVPAYTLAKGDRG